MNEMHRPRSNCQVPKLPEDVNYTQKFDLTNLLQHGRRSGAERVLIRDDTIIFLTGGGYHFSKAWTQFF